MRFYEYLYVSESIEKKAEKIKTKLQKGKLPFNVYLIVLIEEGENQLEFYSTALLYQQIFKKEDLFVVGIAESQIDAIYLVDEIAREVYENTGDLDIRSYILKEQAVKK